MRVITVSGQQVHDGLALPEALPERGFVWIACSRAYFQTELPLIQAALERLTGQPLVDLHTSDLLNPQLPSRYDFSSQYDLMVFRRLAQRARSAGLASHVHPHMLRHSYASHLLQSSGDLRAVQELLGHANITTTQVYTQLDFGHLSKVYDAAHPRARRKG